MQRGEIRDSGIVTPPLIFGTSALGNLYQELDRETRLRLVGEWFRQIEAPVCIDTAGKYGAGLALERIGCCLGELNIAASDIIISNKLGWKRVPLTTGEPRFEPGVWKNITSDAVQSISYDGILECWNQGNELLGGAYRPQLLSVHDPDEYLAAAGAPSDRADRLADIHAAYRALQDLKADGRAAAVGVGAKDWTVIRELVEVIDLDWVMLAGSLTVHTHPEELLRFVEELRTADVFVINSAVFNAGFLVGGSYFDYRRVSRDEEPALFDWRELFHAACRRFEVKPADACVEFALAPAGVRSLAMNTGHPERIADNVRSVERRAPREFWEHLLEAGLIRVTPERLR